MITEQDVIEYLNEKVAKGELGSTTHKYVVKLKELETLKKMQQNEVDRLHSDLKRAENEMWRIKGAIAAVLELAAEEEGLQPALNPKNNNTDK